ncbi:sensor histidine kinase [Actinomyces weissii]|uniref:histidine kinase n=1 Tax=Actinomyces weissii TaxID=675090 RepID=A0A7T7MCM4_9ACTO|nr:sensor histidine kinase [Actinomyces weissii]
MGPDSSDAAILRAATDWRLSVRLLGRGGTRWALPWTDLALGAVCLLLAGNSLSFINRFGASPFYLADLLVAVVLAGAQLLRRWALHGSFCVTAAALAVYAALTWLSPLPLGLSPLSLTALSSLHAVTRWSPQRRWRQAALTTALVGTLVNPVNMLLTGRNQVFSVLSAGAQPQVSVIGLLLVCLAATALAALTVLLTASDARHRRRLAQERARLLVQTRATAVAAERLDLARELHDLLGHSLTAIKVQAATALAVGGGSVQAQALESIERSAASSLEEVRDLVRLLRASPSQPEAPAPTGLVVADALAQALERARQAGLHLVADTPAQPRLREATATWTRLQGLALTRALQEGLTNALRHGDGSAHLTLRLPPGRCELEVTNPLPAAPGPQAVEAPGAGLAGLAERLALVSGSLQTGTTTLPDGTPAFRLQACLPVATTTRKAEEA